MQLGKFLLNVRSIHPFFENFSQSRNTIERSILGCPPKMGKITHYIEILLPRSGRFRQSRVTTFAHISKCPDARFLEAKVFGNRK